MTNIANIAIIGTGKIGADLLSKVNNSQNIVCSAFIGRREDSPGVKFAKSIGVPVFLNGYSVLEDIQGEIDWVIDATSAQSHLAMIPDLSNWKLDVIDMTPSGYGVPFSPLVDAALVRKSGRLHVNLMTCGAQVSSPFAHVIGSVAELDYVESVANLSSDSVGPATRINIDEYIETTEKALRQYSGARLTKAIMVINPAVPPITMKVTIFAKFAGAGPTHSNQVTISKKLHETLIKFQNIIPGMIFPHEPYFEGNLLKVDILVKGSGDFLPTHSGNLDVLTSTALWLIQKTKEGGLKIEDSKF